jgi:hypothetical protein
VSLTKKDAREMSKELEESDLLIQKAIANINQLPPEVQELCAIIKMQLIEGRKGIESTWLSLKEIGAREKKEVKE